MLRKFAGVLGLAALLTSFATPSAKPADNGVPFPGGYLDWFLVNAMTAGKDSPVFGGVNAVHLIHVNPKGFATLKSTGPFPYPDGTIFADDGHDFTVKNGATIEGAKQFVTAMVKDSKKYAATGGWGFQAFAGGDPSKPQIPDTAHAITACFVCHSPQAAQDYVFSTYIR
jgi:hypothetical protein